jgi:hypothetical protein
MAKWGLVTPSKPVDTVDTQKFQSIFAEPLSESKHEAFKVLFQDDFVWEVDGLLP